MGFDYWPYALSRKPFSLALWLKPVTLCPTPYAGFFMYLNFYGFNEKPFELTPDPKYFYLSANHKDALAHLVYAIKEKKGFTVITGEVGTGKTTLLQALLSRLDKNTRVAYLFNPIMETNDFLHAICEEFELKVEKGSKRQLRNGLFNHMLMSLFRLAIPEHFWLTFHPASEMRQLV